MICDLEKACMGSLCTTLANFLIFEVVSKQKANPQSTCIRRINIYSKILQKNHYFCSDHFKKFKNFVFKVVSPLLTHTQMLLCISQLDVQ